MSKQVVKPAPTKRMYLIIHDGRIIGTVLLPELQMQDFEAALNDHFDDDASWTLERPDNVKPTSR